jgi:predicted molibdopterin-dependent oxidoreductase YjgC
MSIHPREHNLTLISEHWVQSLPGTELNLLKSLLKLTQKKTTSKAGGDEMAAIADTLKNSKSPVILVGSEFLQYDNSADILTAIKQLADNIGAGVMPLPAQNNLFGTLLMGTYPELLPGAEPATSTKKLGELKKVWGAAVPKFATKWNANSLNGGKKLKVLYLVGENLPVNAKDLAEFVIVQNIYPPQNEVGADLVLPAAAFTESDGSFINGEGRLQRVKQAVNPPAEAMPDWMIFGKIAQKMGKSGLVYKNAGEIHKEISSLVDGFGNFNKPARKAQPLKMKTELNVAKGKKTTAKNADAKHPFMLSISVTEHTHRGFPLSAWVDGTKTLFLEERVDINPDDAKKARLSDGDEVLVISSESERVWPVRLKPEQAPGTLHVCVHHAEAMNPNPHPVKIKRK